MRNSKGSRIFALSFLESVNNKPRKIRTGEIGTPNSIQYIYHLSYLSPIVGKGCSLPLANSRLAKQEPKTNKRHTRFVCCGNAMHNIGKFLFKQK